MSRRGLFPLLLALVSSFTLAIGGGDVFVDNSPGRSLAPWWPPSPSLLLDLVGGRRAVSLWDRVPRSVAGKIEASICGCVARVRLRDWFVRRLDPCDGGESFVGVDLVRAQAATPWRRVVHDNALLLNPCGVVLRLVSSSRFGDGGYRRKEADGVWGLVGVFNISGGGDVWLHLLGPDLGMLDHRALGSAVVAAVVVPSVELKVNGGPQRAKKRTVGASKAHVAQVDVVAVAAATVEADGVGLVPMTSSQSPVVCESLVQVDFGSCEASFSGVFAGGSSSD